MEFLKAISFGTSIGIILAAIFCAGLITGAIISSPHGLFCTDNQYTMQLRPDDILQVGPNTCAQVVKRK